MKKILLFTLLGSLFFAQQKEEAVPAIYDKYPKGQSDYNGGNIQFYKELHQLIVDKKIQPCENKNELYLAKFVVYPDAAIKFVDEKEIDKIEENKCAYDLIKGLSIYLKGWKSAEIDGKKYTAITSKIIYPNILFENYSEGYDINNYIVDSKFEKGLDYFYKEIQNKAKLRRNWMNDGGKILVNLIIDKNGELNNIFIRESSSGNKKIDEDIINAIKSIDGKWTPTIIHGVPVKSNVLLPITLKKD
ncbi:energy transducer TonB [Elizabethkingia bruuniana]|uniref:energy transducer TonB n=1 Tax=Elizabethkingia bruuniana TaxID=1756149 RepID=UPI00241C3BCC|nr:TonB C-terminal domain-containing protein [Elizabethkingia bruuniana]